MEGVEKIDELKYSIIPIEWITTITAFDITEYFCKYPKQRVTTIMLMKGGKSLENWKSYPMKIIEKFDSYKQATSKEIEIFMSESECEDSLMGRGKRLKITKTHYDHDSYSNNSDEIHFNIFKKVTPLCNVSTSPKTINGDNIIANTESPTLQLIGQNFDTESQNIHDTGSKKLQLIGQNFETGSQIIQDTGSVTLLLIGQNFETGPQNSQDTRSPTQLIQYQNDFCNQGR